MDKTLIECKVCGLGFTPDNMQLISEHHCFICRNCIGLILRWHVGIPNYEIERRKKNG